MEGKLNNVEFRGSQTENFLINSFACKSQTSCKYSYFSEIASKEGYELISKIFKETAMHELVHAKLFFNHLENAQYGEINCSYSYKIGNTEENLYYSIQNEEYGCQKLYNKAEEIALQEGFDSIASTFKHVKNAQKHHANRFKMLYEQIKNKTLYNKDSEQIWACQKCGYLLAEKSAPDFCPNCYAQRGYFEILSENY